MRKTIFSLFGATLIVASMANAAMAAEHLTRHHKPYANTYTNERVRNAYGSYNPVASPPMGWDDNRPHASRLQDEFLPNQPDYVASGGG
jgi:hypothetical protein